MRQNAESLSRHCCKSLSTFSVLVVDHPEMQPKKLSANSKSNEVEVQTEAYSTVVKRGSSVLSWRFHTLPKLYDEGVIASQNLLRQFRVEDLITLANPKPREYGRMGESQAEGREGWLFMSW